MSSPTIPSSLPLRTTAFLLLLAPALFGGKCKCKGEPDPPPDDDTDTQVQPIGSNLQVVSIDPDRVEPGMDVVAKVYGAGFEPGASVDIGTTTSPAVTVIDENTLSVSVPGLAMGRYDVRVSNPDGGSSTLRQGLLVEAAQGVQCDMVRVHFDYNEAGLRADSKAELDGKIACLQAKSGKIRIEGHTDNRGTVEYNLSLGQRRADTVTRYLTGQGIARSRVRTVSFGEERPLDRNSNEQAWALNRRADILAE